jgi:putative zinc finger/helix-turn-helix YgiT family protein
MARCHNCREAEPIIETGVFEYEQVSLPFQVLLVGVTVKRCPACGEEVVKIPDPVGLHRALCLHIVEANRRLHGEEIRLLRKHLGRNAGELAALMGVDPKTLSRWENSKQRMGPVAERLLRLVVRQHLRPDAGAFSDELFPRLGDDPRARPAPLRLTASRRGWERAA